MGEVCVLKGVVGVMNGVSGEILWLEGWWWCYEL